MAAQRPHGQLELFDVTHSAPPRPHRESLGRLFLSLRYDQVIVSSIAGLLGLAVLFGCGVERGKQLVRSERLLLARQQPAPASTPTRVAAEPPALPVEPTAQAEKSEPKAKASEKSTPVPLPKRAPVKLVSDTPARSRYAVQVVTYGEARLAKREMDRLRARGERAFLVMRDGRTMVYVGPFPSRGNASEKVTSLRSRYQDCFVRTL